jgi:predicted metal-dependent hydrolase
MNDLKKDMVDEVRDVVGGGFTQDYYSNLASGFISIAEHYVDVRNKSLLSREEELEEACRRVIQMSRQHAEDQYGNAEKAESWACITTLRAALSGHKPKKEGE